MPIPVTCVCGYSTMAPDSAAGRRGKCKRCGATIDIPSPDDDIVMAVPAPPPPVAIPAIVTDDDEDGDNGPALQAMPREPWFYPTLVIFADIVAGLGLAGWSVWAFSVFRAMEDAPAAAKALAVIFALGPPTVALAGTLTVCGLILLAVDLARNVRVIRLQGHMRS